MKSFKVIPAMDLMEGQIVRLVRGRFDSKKVYPWDPVKLAQQFLEAGLDYLHVVDLDGARSESPMNLKTVKKVAKTGIRIELGGGIRSLEHIEMALEAGATKIVLGTRLVSEEGLLKEWTHKFPRKLIASLDVRNGRVAVLGWESTTQVKATDLVKKIDSLGFLQIIYTDISKDGTLSGPDIAGLKKVAESTILPVVASGGIRSIGDIKKVKGLKIFGIKGVIVGKAFYERKITLEELSKC